MPRTYTHAEARRALPHARERIGEVAAMAAELHALAAELRAERPTPGALPAAKALEARIDEALGWFGAEGIQVKGIAPALLDFPARAVHEGRRIEVLLCWRDGEDDVTTWHPPETGYLGRRPIAELDEV